MPQDDFTSPDHPSARDAGVPRPTFSHLRRLTDEYGLWEHALHSTPRREHGFCTDDNARALVIVAREQIEDVADLLATYVRFVHAARKPDGTFHNRRDAAGTWVDDKGSDDSQGRAWWGLGAVARHAPEEWMRAAALEEFDSCATFQSSHVRANAYAALGAVELVTKRAAFHPAVELLDRTSTLITAAARSTIPWPQARLTYDNARIPEALIAAGVALGDERRKALGIRLLEWLTGNESRVDHFSFTPVGGRRPGDLDPGFDQQPLEAWAMADACYRAWSATGESVWRRRALQAGRWLLGRNDTGAVLYDIETGSTSDGLTPNGVNANQGAESTLAGIGALQVAAMCRRQP